jgi:hypothetical protein
MVGPPYRASVPSVTHDQRTGPRAPPRILREGAQRRKAYRTARVPDQDNAPAAGWSWSLRFARRPCRRGSRAGRPAPGGLRGAVAADARSAMSTVSELDWFKSSYSGSRLAAAWKSPRSCSRVRTGLQGEAGLLRGPLSVWVGFLWYAAEGPMRPSAASERGTSSNSPPPLPHRRSSPSCPDARRSAAPTRACSQRNAPAPDGCCSVDAVGRSHTSTGCVNVSSSSQPTAAESPSG